MAQIVERAIQCSISTSMAGWRPARSLKLLKACGPRNSRMCPSKKNVVLATAVSREVRTQEAQAEIVRSQNGRTFGERTVKLKATITVGKKKRMSSDEMIADFVDRLADLLGQHITLQLVSVDPDPDTKSINPSGKRSQISKLEGWVLKTRQAEDSVEYWADFEVDENFGIPGAVIVTNKHKQEIFLEAIALECPEVGTIYFVPNSWVPSEQSSPEPSVFFSNQVYLPSSTPKGLEDLRKQDIKSHRGEGTGMRQVFENIYDYDVYNDLCDVDKDKYLARPTLGGSKEYPYPRRNRTGRPPTLSDKSRESRLQDPAVPYVPRDECFEPVKLDDYFCAAIRGLVQQKFPDINDHFMGRENEFQSFDEIDRLYNSVPQIRNHADRVRHIVRTLSDLPINVLLPQFFRTLLQAAAESPTNILWYPQPQILSRDKFSWLQDNEFARQCLAGLNPCAIQRLKTFPPVSGLHNPELYGPRESAIQAHHIIGQLEGLSIQQALDDAKLYTLDYHDVYIPYINEINALGDRTSYATRTLFFLTHEGTLKPLAIELSLPPPISFQKVYLPSSNATERWLWNLAKAHVSCNDTGYHQLVSHWTRTHASTEPYCIALNRTMSPMHPIYKLLHPHLRYTLEINAAARQSLICSAGVIETTFLPGKYAMQISSGFYGSHWRFDEQSLPEELISRGVAEKDESAPHGLKLLIEDYPFANDGLLIWSTIETWVSEYVSIYYKSPEIIQGDKELQAWWEEVRTKGHEDKKDEEWWPQLQDPQALVQILSTIIWVCSGLHAAVNFGQFGYAGFMPNKPTMMRKFIPQPDTEEYERFMENPQLFFLSCLPSRVQATTLMSVVESLSRHSPDEEYLGSNCHDKWFGCPEAVEAFKRFQRSLTQIGCEIDSRNKNVTLRNRTGAGIIPYELLHPESGPGITGRGVPNSISI